VNYGYFSAIKNALQDGRINERSAIALNVLLAMAGKISADLVAIILARPQLLADLIWPDPMR
jgi:hypothetical protein